MHDHLKTVIITGGNKGIGESITRRFAEQNFKVFVGSRTKPNFEHNNVIHIQTDVRIENDLNNLVEQAILSTGRLDVFINNAGYSEWRPLSEITNEFLDDIISTNLKGAFWGCKAAIKYMRSGGSIINISSIAGKRGSSNNSAYVATKFGMNGLTQSLSKELGPNGIRVNGICPVLIHTDGLDQALKSQHSPAGSDPIKFIENFAKANSALLRLPDGNDVADMCIFLSSDQSKSITGQNINVDCGVFPQ